MDTADLGLPDDEGRDALPRRGGGGRRVGVPSTALFTDQYELTMLQAALKAGTAARRSVFEVFTRRLPDGRRYGVVAGTGRVLDAVEDFRFDPDVLDFLRERQIVDEETLQWLAGYRFTGDIWGYPEGEVYFPGSPVLRVEGSFAECVLLETVILSILNHDSAIAAAASRMSSAAGDRPLIEMGARRTHELSAVAAARAAYIGGFATTSDLAAGFRYGIPTVGTSAHAFTLLHDNERDAFRAQVDSLGRGTTLLVDTYDVAEAVRTAVEAAGPELGAVRIDSGDLLLVAHRVRQQLDELGAVDTKIIVTSDLDEYAIASLAAAPVDAYGVGTQLVTGSGHPTCSMVYKLVARAESADPRAPLTPVAKRSSGGKTSVGGRKWAARRLDAYGVAETEVIGTGPVPADLVDRQLLVELVKGGEVVAHEPLDAVRDRHAAARADLPLSATQLSRGEPVLATEYVHGEAGS
jgi:nicotinate phosphoribosyltransferase